MAELAGVVIGAAGLIALESTVEQFFEKVATWKDHGKDYEHYHLKLDMAAVAYGRWRQSVELTDDNIHDAHLPVANAKETETVQKLLGAIAAAFQDAEKRGGQLEAKTAPAPEVAEKATGSLAARYQAMIEKRQKGAGAWKKLRWVVHDKKVLTTLTERVEEYVDSLVRLFPGPVEETQKMMATLDLEELIPTDSVNERETLVQVANVSAKVDHIMQQVATESIQRVDARHKFIRNRSEEKGQAIYGDSYGDGVEIRLDGPGHHYEGNVVKGNAKAVYGDRVGMPDIFSD